MNLDMCSIGVVFFGISFFFRLSVPYLCNPLFVECQAEGELVAEVVLNGNGGGLSHKVAQRFLVSHDGSIV